jgi:integration host factor subunit beta
LIQIIAGRFPQLIARDIELSVTTILAGITHELASGGRAEIREFGSFALNYRPPRIGRNPKTGERVEVPAKRVPHFKMGKEMREKVDG